MKMSCREQKEQMSLYLDGLLTPAQTRRLEEHVALCPNCRNKLTLFQEIPTALRTDRMLAPRPEFTTTVMQRIIVTQQQNRLGENRLNTASLILYQAGKTTKPHPKVLPFEGGKFGNKSLRTSSAYMLRFGSLAALLIVTIGIAFFFSNTGTGANGIQTSVNTGISSFATLITDSLQNPMIFVPGIALTIVLIFTTWKFIQRSRHTR